MISRKSDLKNKIKRKQKEEEEKEEEEEEEKKEEKEKERRKETEQRHQGPHPTEERDFVDLDKASYLTNNKSFWWKKLESRAVTRNYLKCPIFNKETMRHAKKCSMGEKGKQSIETITEGIQMLDITDRLRSGINIFKEWKETRIKGIYDDDYSANRESQ